MRVDPEIKTSEELTDEPGLSRFDNIKQNLAIAFTVVVLCYFFIYALFL
ncbi:MAG: hypothetical protein K0S09_1538 [Sphingobacteriaceae bacterium]|jgi:hypothetical protein|nr:hypothetical protein [Sphingobacteriaceae bacterium]